MKRKTTKLLASLAGVMLLMTAVSAHALTSEFLIDKIKLKADTKNDFTLLSFATEAGPFTSATLVLTYSHLIEGTSGYGKYKTSTPPDGTVFTISDNPAFLGNMTFSNPHKESLNLNQYLSVLNGAKGATGIDLGVGINKGGLTLNSAKLNYTVAPEPISMVLMGAGMAGLPFARRLRNSLRG